MIAQIKLAVMSSFADLRMEFKSDGTYVNFSRNPMTQQEETKTGTWRYADGKVYTTETGKEEEKGVGVKELSSSRMVILAPEEDNSPLREMVMVKAE
ncbi:MAG: hypothetical protein OHK0053_38460 [Microscillaceae bacterium]